MREILYLQAGTVSNFVGTHFWNEQESYFTYGEDAEEPLVDHDPGIFSHHETLHGHGDYRGDPGCLVPLQGGVLRVRMELRRMVVGFRGCRMAQERLALAG